MATAGFNDSELLDLQRRLVIPARGPPVGGGSARLTPMAPADSRGPYYRDLSENNRTRSVVLEPARGLIFDRNGILLANNVPSFAPYVTLEDVKDRALVAQLASLLSLEPELIQKKLSTGKGGKLQPPRSKIG